MKFTGTCMALSLLFSLPSFAEPKKCQELIDAVVRVTGMGSQQNEILSTARKKMYGSVEQLMAASKNPNSNPEAALDAKEVHQAAYRHGFMEDQYKTLEAEVFRWTAESKATFAQIRAKLYPQAADFPNYTFAQFVKEDAKNEPSRYSKSLNKLKAVLKKMAQPNQDLFNRMDKQISQLTIFSVAGEPKAVTFTEGGFARNYKINDQCQLMDRDINCQPGNGIDSENDPLIGLCDYLAPDTSTAGQRTKAPAAVGSGARPKRDQTR